MTDIYPKRAVLSAELSRKRRKLSATAVRAPSYYEYDYNNLINRPSIEGNELVGDKTYEELGLRGLTAAELAMILD